MIKHLWKKWICEFNFNPFWNIIKFPINFYKFIKELFSFLKNGYPYEAIYNHCDYLINMEIAMLKNYLEVHQGYPGDNKPEGGRTDEEWVATIEHMIKLLERMSRNDPFGVTFTDIIEYNKETDKVTKEFFELFNKWFYDLWD